MKFIGIDPGLTGGIATLDESGRVITVFPMPIIQGTKKNYMDTKAVAEYLISLLVEDIPTDEQLFVAIEKQIPIGGMRQKVMILATKKIMEVSIGRGMASTAYFQQGYGELIGVCTALGIPFITPAPITWKKNVLEGLSWQGNKAASILYAQNRWPRVSLLPTPRSRKPSDGLSDALCLAEHGRKEKQF